ncbi:hypothetical protein HETIRDRAFT_449828 [Heterobasidion irregulare TC 32-1]|uniref:Uncharacterized protein n=1 Tax=Heterobasidion irregulare (strain TC 32-1) TaxID=747525 RepID=W4KGA1_HETIT|nr:uncharacterized protein HETIRDRAFT_449828 [Heterobasidion irregulare TC 32-1]ETW84320.1 hypothetical protein HETIRDRAFT_449828 [Heterobasidion irregulare TC 32-1]
MRREDRGGDGREGATERPHRPARLALGAEATVGNSPTPANKIHPLTSTRVLSLSHRPQPSSVPSITPRGPPPPPIKPPRAPPPSVPSRHAPPAFPSTLPTHPRTHAPTHPPCPAQPPFYSRPLPNPASPFPLVPLDRPTTLSGVETVHANGAVSRAPPFAIHRSIHLPPPSEPALLFFPPSQNGPRHALFPTPAQIAICTQPEPALAAARPARTCPQPLPSNPPLSLAPLPTASIPRSSHLATATRPSRTTPPPSPSHPSFRPLLPDRLLPAQARRPPPTSPNTNIALFGRPDTSPASSLSPITGPSPPSSRIPTYHVHLH